MTAHKHAALMLQYAQDAAETDKPWERWEWRDVNTDQFITCNQHPSWSLNGGFRRKPQVIRVGRHTFPRPIRERPRKGDVYWYVGMSQGEHYVCSTYWQHYDEDYGRLNKSVCHLTEAAAQAHADTLNAICRGDIE